MNVRYPHFTRYSLLPDDDRITCSGEYFNRHIRPCQELFVIYLIFEEEEAMYRRFSCRREYYRTMSIFL